MVAIKTVPMVRLAVSLLLGAVLINLGVAVYDVAVLGHGGLAILALVRALMSAGGMFLMLAAVHRLDFELRCVDQQAKFLRSFLLARTHRERALL